MRIQSPATLPIDVALRVREYLALLETEGAQFVRDVYLVGSVALGDFQEGQSDIDFVALVSAPPTLSQLERLARIHAMMTSTEGPHFDGFYIERAKLARAPTTNEPAPFSVNGTFHAQAPCFEINPVTWLCLSEHGIGVRGVSPEALGIAADPDALQAFQVNNLRTYWEPWIEQGSKALDHKAPDDLVDAKVLAWGLLGCLRIAHTLGTGHLISKTEAGRWALTRYPAQWRGVIQDALSTRAGKISELPVTRCRHGLDFMRQVAADALAAADE